MQIYLSTKIAMLDELNVHGCGMSGFSRRSTLLRGARQEIVKMAQNEPT